MKLSRTLSLILAALMLLLCVSCGDAATGDDTKPSAAETTAAGADETTQDPTLDENGYKKDDLPELNFNKSTFRILAWSESSSWDFVDDESTTGDTINDSIYKRKMDTEERLGVEIDITTQKGSWDYRNTFIDAVYNSVNSGADSYNLIDQYTPAAAIGAMRGLYMDLTELNHLNLEQPWWPQDITTASAINGRVYSVAGDVSPTLIRNMVCILTNLSIAEDVNAENFYDLVKDHKWTAAKFLEYAVGTVTGMSSDGTQCYTTILPNNVVYDNLFYAGGFRFAEKTADGGLQLSETLSSQKMSDWYTLWHDFLFNNDDVAILADGIKGGFTEGEALFYFGSISDVQNYMQDIEFKFGILPYPLYDENQENYCTICGYWVSLFSVPTNTSDKDMSGAVLECLGSEGYRTITPAVYEVSFKYRFLNSIENAEVFQILHDTQIFEPGRLFADQISCFSSFRQAAIGTYDNWNSYFQSNSKLWQKSIKKIIEKLG